MSIPLISKYFFVLLYQIQFNMAICTYMGQAEETEYGIKGEKRGTENWCILILSKCGIFKNSCINFGNFM